MKKSEVIAGNEVVQIATNVTERTEFAALILPGGYDPNYVTAEDVEHDGAVWVLDRDPREDAEAAEVAFNALCSYLDLDSQEQEDSILSADQSTLPREISSAELRFSAAYYLALIEQVLESVSPSPRVPPTAPRGTRTQWIAFESIRPGDQLVIPVRDAGG